MLLDKEYNIIKSVLAQKKYCEEHGFPRFAPQDGCCWKCQNNIYVSRVNPDLGVTITTGISVEEAGKHLVTGCPQCHASIVD
jgi:hypothetical protein